MLSQAVFSDLRQGLVTTDSTDQRYADHGILLRVLARHNSRGMQRVGRLCSTSLVDS